MVSAPGRGAPWALSGQMDPQGWCTLSGKESAQGCIPKRLPGRPDEALGGGNQGPSLGEVSSALQ